MRLAVGQSGTRGDHPLVHHVKGQQEGRGFGANFRYLRMSCGSILSSPTESNGLAADITCAKCLDVISASTRGRVSTWPNSRARQDAYDRMRSAHYRTTGGGWVVPDMTGVTTIEEANQRRDASFVSYTGSALDELRGMAAIVAIVEGGSVEEILKKVRGS